MDAHSGFPQKLFFNKIAPPNGKDFAQIAGIVEDRQGYMGFAGRGLYRYDGITIISYKKIH
jgi:hypothetical protein